jgi:hypothetical protein
MTTPSIENKIEREPGLKEKNRKNAIGQTSDA